MSSEQYGSSAKAILYAFLANLGIAVAKSFAAIYTASGSMLAEAIHSFADCSNQVLLYWGLRQSQRPPDHQHPLGYGKLSYFWSFIVAILLFSMGGLFSIYEGFHKLDQPEGLTKPWIALTVLAVAIALERLSLLGCLEQIKIVRGDKSLPEWLKNTRNAELVVVLGEDIAAIIGLVIAFVFVSLAALTGDPFYDAVGSICVGVVLILVSLFVGSRIKSLIVGRSAEPDLRKTIDDIIGEDSAIAEVFNTITLQFGPDVMLAAKIRMEHGLSIEESVEKINALERKIKEQASQVRWCFIEPDFQD